MFGVSFEQTAMQLFNVTDLKVKRQARKTQLIAYALLTAPILNTAQLMQVIKVNKRQI